MGQQMGMQGQGKEERRQRLKQKGASMRIRSPLPPHRHVRNSLHCLV